MEAFLISVATVASTGVLAGVGYLVKLVLDMSRRLEADDEKWRQNASDHKRAFKEIDALKQEIHGLKRGQDRMEQHLSDIETKLDGIKDGG